MLRSAGSSYRSSAAGRRSRAAVERRIDAPDDPTCSRSARRSTCTGTADPSRSPSIALSSLRDRRRRDAEAAIVDAALRRDLPGRRPTSSAPTTYLELQALTGILPFGLRHYWKGHFLRELDAARSTRSSTATADDAARRLVPAARGDHGPGPSEPEGGAAFGQRGGALERVSALAIWEDPADDEANIAWARRTADGLKGVVAHRGGYVNYAPVDETAERVRAAYGDERWDRLRAVKRRYDPDNVFRFNHNIPPADA